MGLDAAVYKRLDELPFTEQDLHLVTVDPRTGQINFEDAALFRAWDDRIVAVHKRIGNMTLVKSLRTELEGFRRGSHSTGILITKILYSATHSGDIISKEDFGPLRNEIRFVRELAQEHASHELTNFLRDIEELMAASEQHGNPIVFI
jgi:hypothetical protein